MVIFRECGKLPLSLLCPLLSGQDQCEKLITHSKGVRRYVYPYEMTGERSLTEDRYL